MDKTVLQLLAEECARQDAERIRALVQQASEAGGRLAAATILDSVATHLESRPITEHERSDVCLGIAAAYIAIVDHLRLTAKELRRSSQAITAGGGKI